MKKLSFLCLFALLVLLHTSCRKDDDNIPVAPIDTTTQVATKPVDFTVTENGITVNPYGYTPLSAQLNFYSVKSGRTFIRIHGRHGALSDVTHLFSDTGVFHSIPVIGMYADTVNTVHIRIVGTGGDTLAQSTVNITTQALPANLPSPIVATTVDESKLEAGMYLVSSLSTYVFGGGGSQPSIPFILDDYGDIRWVLDYSSNTGLSKMFYNDGIARLKNGNFYFGDETTQKIYEVGVLGNIINNWPIPTGYYFHHEVHEETDGNFILTASKVTSTFTDGSPTTGDYVIEIDRTSKALNVVWDLKESLNEYRRVWGAGTAGDWFHGNAVYDDSTDNTIVVSGRNQGVVKLDRNNNIKWILAPHKDWGLSRRGDTLSKYLLTPVDASGNVIADTTVAYGSTITSGFEWNCYQHSPIQLPNGDIMLFDNGTNRTLDPVDGNNPYNSVPGKYSRAVEYKINASNMTVQQVWQYGKERGQDAYSAIISSVQFLPGSNHVVFAPGFNVLNATGRGGKIIDVDYATGQVVNEISISTGNVFASHRAKRINVYPNNL